MRWIADYTLGLLIVLSHLVAISWEERRRSLNATL
jgi:hypothetical protein